MARYIILCKFTQQGITAVKDSPKRLDAAKAAFKAYGAELKEFYLTMGRYDMIVVGDAPNDEVVGKLTLAIASLGNLSTETLRAFTEAEYRNIIAGLP